MRQNAEKLAVESLETFPQLTIVQVSEGEEHRSSQLRPELLALGWEPRARRLAALRSAGYKLKS